MRSVQQIWILLCLVLILLSATGCSSLGKKLKAFMGGKDVNESAAKRAMGPRFSETENLRYASQRQYKRMNRQKFEEDAEVASQAGSLWVMEGQTSYLFAQNTTRMVGDPLNVKIDGEPKTKLAAKVRVISKLLERLENAQRRPAAVADPQAAAAKPQNAAAGQAQQNQAGAQGANAAGTPEGDKAENAFAVQTVPTRIVEALKDGSYRVKGTQSFMIGKKEYKVIVTGVVRQEDFDSEGTSAAKLLDSQFDIVSTKKAMSL